ncbi:hypothetical protein BC358_13405 [Hydrogenophaga sp. H7]|nr:hypothetical protein BC358_13405 [Hydrogenophaga sp. H7]
MNKALLSDTFVAGAALVRVPPPVAVTKPASVSPAARLVPLTSTTNVALGCRSTSPDTVRRPKLEELLAPRRKAPDCV